jgi:hypothetical protein
MLTLTESELQFFALRSVWLSAELPAAIVAAPLAPVTASAASAATASPVTPACRRSSSTALFPGLLGWLKLTGQPERRVTARDVAAGAAFFAVGCAVRSGAAGITDYRRGRLFAGSSEPTPFSTSANCTG